MDRNTIGKESEQLALKYLEQHGLTLIDQNYHSRRGEIDLIMSEHDCLVFVEVRYRKSARFGSAIESVTQSKQAKIIHTAQHFIQRYNPVYASYRFDVVAITPSSTRDEIIWLKNAFQLN